jgi:thioredoxin
MPPLGNAGAPSSSSTRYQSVTAASARVSAPGSRPRLTLRQAAEDSKDECAPSAAAAAENSDSASSSQAKFSSFDTMLSSYKEPVLVDFFATWCGPCVAMAAELKTVSSTLSGVLNVAKIDTDKYPSLSQLYKIEGLPTLILFKDGQVVHRIV